MRGYVDRLGGNFDGTVGTLGCTCCRSRGRLSRGKRAIRPGSRHGRRGEFSGPSRVLASSRFRLPGAQDVGSGGQDRSRRGGARCVAIPVLLLLHRPQKPMGDPVQFSEDSAELGVLGPTSKSLGGLVSVLFGRGSLSLSWAGMERFGEDSRVGTRTAPGSLAGRNLRVPELGLRFAFRVSRVPGHSRRPVTRSPTPTKVPFHWRDEALGPCSGLLELALKWTARSGHREG